MAEKLFKLGNRLVAAADKYQALERAGLPPCYCTQDALNAVSSPVGALFTKGLYSGTTATQFARLGVHGGINVRAGEFWRNDHASPRIDRRNARKAMAENGVPGYYLRCYGPRDRAGVRR